MATLYLDEDVSQHIGPFLEATGHTIYTTYQQGRAETLDGDQLLYAASNAPSLDNQLLGYDTTAEAWRLYDITTRRYRPFP